MTVKELVEQLGHLPEDCEVLLSRDSEGNKFAKVDDWSLCQIADGTSAFNVEVDHEADEEYDAVIIWPT